VEKVIFRGRTYARPDWWPGVRRYAWRRVRETASGTVCSLWALDTPIEDHLLLDAGGRILRVEEHRPEPTAPWPWPPALVAGVCEAIVAASAAPLAPFIRAASEALAFEWGPVDGDLVAFAADRARLSSRLWRLLARRLREAGTATDRGAIGVSALGELAAIVGDELRTRGQARLAARPPDEQAAALAGGPPVAGAPARLVEAVAALWRAAVHDVA
jgi:hypothetical protein